MKALNCKLYFLLLILLASGIAQAAELDIKLVKSRIAAIEQLPESDQNTDLLNAYSQVQQTLQTAKEFDNATRAYAADIVNAPKLEQSIRARMDNLTERSAEQIRDSFASYNQGQLEFRLAKMQSQLAEKTAALNGLEDRLALQESNNLQRRQRLAEIGQQLRDLPTVNASIETVATPSETEADQWLLVAKKNALGSEQVALQGAIQSQPARYALLRAQRAQITREIEFITLERNVAESQLELIRSKQADKTRLKLESLSKGSPLVSQLASENLALIEQQIDLNEALAVIINCEHDLGIQLSQLKELYSSSKRRVEFARGSVELGHILITQLQQYSHAPADKSSCKLRDQPADIVIARIALEEQLQQLDNPDRYVDKLLELMGETATISARDRRHAEELAREKQKLLTTLISIQTNYVSSMSRLNNSKDELADEMQEYNEFLSAYLMWVRSQPPVSMKSLTNLPGDITAALQAAQKIELHRLSFNWISAILAAAAGLILLLRRSLVRWGDQLVARSQRPRDDFLMLTIGALLVDLVISLPGFLVLLSLAALLSPLGGIAINLSQVLVSIGTFYALLISLATVCRPGGTGERIFLWPESLCELARTESKWQRRWWLPLLALASMLYMLGASSGLTESVRVLVLAASIVVGLRWLRGRHLPLLEANSASFRHLRLFRSLALVLVLLTIAALLTGYVHTTLVIISQLLTSISIFWGMLLVDAVLMRWLLIVRRRVRFRELVEARAAAANDEPSPDEDRTELRAISEASGRLVSFIVIIIGLVLLWLVWEPLMPVLNILSEIELWSSTVVENDISITQTVTLEALVKILALAIAFFIAARTLPNLLELLLLQQNVSAGPRYTLTRLTTYIIIGGGSLTILNMIGVSWSKLQWLVAALGVGIGFGLQEIVANFISGIILLFERPIRVGDIVTIGETDGKVTRIQIRATTLLDWDGKELVVPNKEFVTGRLLNWTLSDNKTRVIIAVGIAYGSDLEAAMALLEEIIREDLVVLADPEPSIIMNEFGDNSLVLKARYFITNADQRLLSMSNMHRKIYQRFNAAGISIAFPQRDVHLDSKDPIRIKLEPGLD